MGPRDALVDTLIFLSPLRILEGLSADLAERRLPQLPHSIAEIVAHLSFWQEWFMRRVEGQAEPMVASAGLGWPAVAPGSWPDVEARFRVGLEQLIAVGEKRDPDTPVLPAIEFGPLARYTLRDVIAHVAQHNAHHLGQVIVMRQLAGQWPPPAGSWTW